MSMRLGSRKNDQPSRPGRIVVVVVVVVVIVVVIAVAVCPSMFDYKFILPPLYNLLFAVATPIVYMRGVLS